MLVSVGGRHRHERARPRRRLADPRHRRPPQRPLGAGPDGLDPLRRPCHLQHRGPALEPSAAARCTTSSTLDTGAPVQGSWRTVSVAAGSCTDANIAATAAVIRDERRPGMAGRARSAGAPGRPAGPRERRGWLARRRGADPDGLGGMSLPLAASGGSIYWYLTRSTGAVALVLLTARDRARRARRAALEHPALAALPDRLAAPQRVAARARVPGRAHPHLGARQLRPDLAANAVIPFVGSYRPFWLGLGAVAFDLILAVIVTSLLRARIGYDSWRAVHWLTYASWPIALLHGFGTGSDVKSTWLLALSVLCLLAVLRLGRLARARRLAARARDPRRGARRRGRVLAVPAAVASRRAARAPNGPGARARPRRCCPTTPSSSSTSTGGH